MTYPSLSWLSVCVDEAAARRAGWYVYLLLQPSGEIFYVGKGKGNRIDGHEPEARRRKKPCFCRKCRAIRKIWELGGTVGKRIIYATNSELDAYQREAELIAVIGLSNLENMVPGDSWRAGKVIYSWQPQFSPFHDEADLAGYVRYTRIRARSRKELRSAVQTWRERRLQHLGEILTEMRRYVLPTHPEARLEYEQLEAERRDLYAQLFSENLELGL